MASFGSILRNGQRSQEPRVIVERIAYDVDTEFLSSTIEKAFSSDGANVFYPSSLVDNSKEIASTAKRLLAEIEADEKWESERKTRTVDRIASLTAQNRRRKVKFRDPLPPVKKRVPKNMEKEKLEIGQKQQGRRYKAFAKSNASPRKDYLSDIPEETESEQSTSGCRKGNGSRTELRSMNLDGVIVNRNRTAESLPIAKPINEENETGDPVKDEVDESAATNSPHEKPTKYRRTVFCADSSDEEEDDISTDNAEKGTPQIARNRDNGYPSAIPDDQDGTLYPCTVCRKSSTQSQLIRCWNCPRYFHKECFITADPSKGQFCPKCAHVALPNLSKATSTISAPVKTKKRKLDTMMVEKRNGGLHPSRRKPSGSAVSTTEVEKTCRVCKNRFKPKHGGEESIYCDDACVEVVIERVKLAFADVHEQVLVADGTNGNAISNLKLPMVENFGPWLKMHRRYYPILPAAVSVPNQSQVKAAEPVIGKPTGKDQTKRTVVPMAAVSDAKETGGQECSAGSDSTRMKQAAGVVDSMRLNVRKAFRDALIARAKGAYDILLTNEEIRLIALDLENNVYKAQGETSSGASYKQQCRNLLSNLRNPSNKGLFRRLLNGELPCKRAASLSAQQMSSKEFSYWAPIDEFEAANGVGSKSTSSKVGASRSDVLSLLGDDATAQHKSHLFDLRCKICTGKQKDDSSLEKFPKNDRKIQDFKTSHSAVPTTFAVRRDLGEKLIRRGDGKLDIMIPVPMGPRSDPLRLNSLSPSTSQSDLSPLSIDSLSQ